MTEAIDVLVNHHPILADGNPACHAAHMRMRRVHAAVDHGDADSFTRAFS